MNGQKQNHYGSLCTEMYEILHAKAPWEELEFYLSYADKNEKILEPMCGSGRVLIPFLQRGFDISGIDLSGEMLERLKQKAPDAKVVQTDLLSYFSKEKFSYIFIPAGSVSLFTDLDLCKNILGKLKELLSENGKLVFSVETMADRCPDDEDYQVSAAVKTKEGYDLILKSKNYYEEQSQTQFMPGIYELYDGKKLLKRESMDFQTHLYRFGEMEGYLKELGFTDIKTYASFLKDAAVEGCQCEMFLLECSVSR